MRWTKEAQELEHRPRPGEGIAVTTGLGVFAGWLGSMLSRREREAVEDVADRLAA